MSSASKTKSTNTNNVNANGKIYYLDYNGTTPIYPPVFEAMVPYLKEHFGNPSSSHCMGREPRRAIDEARKQILKLLVEEEEKDDDNATTATTVDNVDRSAIWFTGCGTESDNLAIQLALQACANGGRLRKGQGRPPHVVTSNVEHPAVELYLKHLSEEEDGNTATIDVTYVPVDQEGRVAAQDVIEAITEDTVLVTVMLANNESGTLQPIREIATACRKRGVLMHTDAAQAAGKVSINLKDLGHPDMVSIVGHKMGAPKGIAALYVRPGCLEEEEFGRKIPHQHGIMLIGGGQEFGRRGGTENTPYIVGFGRAAELAQRDLTKNARHMGQMRNRLLHNLQAKLGGDGKVRPNGPVDPSKRLPNTLSVGFDGVHSGQVLSSIGHVVAASAGAACHGTGSVSAVLTAMQVPESFARGTLRLSLGPATTPEEVDEASEIIAQAIQKQWTAAAQ